MSTGEHAAARADDGVRVAVVAVLRHAHVDAVTTGRLADWFMNMVVDPLRAMLERFETEHVEFSGPNGENVHPVWCRECRVDRWLRIAVRLAVAGDGSYRLLSTGDRDALEAALAEYRQQAQHSADEVAELDGEAAGGEPARGSP